MASRASRSPHPPWARATRLTSARAGGTATAAASLEDTPPEVTAGGTARTERRERRIDAFADALTCLGVTDPANAPRTAVIEAAKRIRVSEKTAMGYRTALRQRQQEGARHDAPRDH